MAENDNQNPIAFLISKFQGFFNLPTPSPSPSKTDSVVVLSDKINTEEEKSSVTVRVPRGQTDMPSSLKLEGGDEVCPDDRNTNSLLLWQVYAIGGFFVVRWVLARLNERRNKKKPSDEEPSPNPNDN